VDGSKALRKYQIPMGKTQAGVGQGNPLIAEHVLTFKGRKPTLTPHPDVFFQDEIGGIC